MGTDIQLCEQWKNILISLSLYLSTNVYNMTMSKAKKKQK